jgi:hypothetical protein
MTYLDKRLAFDSRLLTQPIQVTLKVTPPKYFIASTLNTVNTDIQSMFSELKELNLS